MSLATGKRGVMHIDSLCFGFEDFSCNLTCLFFLYELVRWSVRLGIHTWMNKLTSFVNVNNCFTISISFITVYLSLCSNKFNYVTVHFYICLFQLSGLWHKCRSSQERDAWNYGPAQGVAQPAQKEPVSNQRWKGHAGNSDADDLDAGVHVVCER